MNGNSGISLSKKNGSDSRKNESDLNKSNGYLVEYSKYGFVINAVELEKIIGK